MTQTPKIEIDQFWEVLGDSQLLPPPELLRLRQKSAETETPFEDSEAVAKWFIKENILTALQAEVLLAGHPGPFEFGRYRLVGAKSRLNVWTARDRKTAHPVWLHFFSGDSPADLARWDEIERRVEQFSAIDHPNVVRVYESIVTRTHRFVSTAPAGNDSLAERMPIKRRITETQALEVVREVANAIVELESHGLQHGALELKHVFTNVKQGVTQVMLPVVADKATEPSHDTRALGRMLFRLLTGRDAPAVEKLLKAGATKFTDTMSSRKVSSEVSKLVYDATVADESFTAKSFLNRLNEVSESRPTKTAVAVPTESEFIAGLTPWKTDAVVHDDVPDMDAVASEREPSTDSGGRQKRKLPVAAMIGISLFGFAAILGIGALLANLKKLEPPRIVAESDAEPKEKIAQTNESKRQQLAELLASQSYVQELIPDDQKTLWESPTTGFPIDVSLLPPSPRLIAAVNWKSLYESKTGPLTLQALGPQTDQLLQDLESRIGFSLADIDSTVISLHSNLAFEYEAFVV